MIDGLEKYVRSGQILVQVREFVKGLSVEGKRILDLCEQVEKKIRELGANPAFPCNVGVNEIAAHYTSPLDDASVVPARSLVKIDFGVELDGCITDSAITVALDPAHDSMIVAAETALHEALAAVAPGRKLSEIGSIVERCVQRYGFKPIRNLTGHRIDRYSIHAGKSVPNVSGIESGRFEVGEVYAIEPFVTLRDAGGMVRDMDVSYIYRFVKRKGAKSKDADKLARYIRETYKSLPFASRWIYKSWHEGDARSAFKELEANRCVAGYPVLVEVSGKVVSQAEHTVVVTESGCKILTV